MATTDKAEVMAVHLLDTTALTHYLRGHLVLTANVNARTTTDTVGTTTVNVEEMVSGWLNYIQRAKTNTLRAHGSQNLADAITFLAGLTIYPATEAAWDRFDHLKGLKLNVGSMDLRIAAVALELGATVVTNNAIDFGRAPGLLWEDWTV